MGGNIPQCPKCGSVDLIRSRRKGCDRFFSWLGYYPFICRGMGCSHRFRYRSRRTGD